MPAEKKDNPGIFLFWVISTAVFYVLIMLTAVLKRHFAFETNAYDLALYDQILWNCADGNLLISSIKGNVNCLTDHFSLILLFLVPVYFVFPGPLMLLVVQTCAFAAAGVIIFFISRMVLKNNLISIIWMISFLAFMPLRKINLFDFHDISLAIPLLLSGYLSYLGNKKLFSAILFCMAGLCREEILLVIFLFGWYLLLAKKDKALGPFLIIYGFFLFLGAVFVFPKYFGKEYVYFSRYAYLGSSINEILMNSVLKPGIILKRIFNISTLNYVLLLVGPLAGLPLLAPGLLIMCAPTFMANILSDMWQQRTFDYHYVSGIIPFLFIAGITGCRKVFDANRWFEKRFHLNGNRRLNSLVILLALCTVLFYGKTEVQKIRETNVLNEYHWVRGVLKYMINPDASVTAESHLVPHLSQRRYIYMFPEVPDKYKSDYYVFYTKLKSWPLNPDERDRLMAELPEKGYEKIFDEKGLIIFKFFQDPI